MSGAASIAAAKNRRTKPDPNLKPNISCSTKSGASCPLPPGSKTVNKSYSTPTLFDEESLQIKGPMHVMQAIQVHEQRLNKLDDKINQQLSLQQYSSLSQQISIPESCVQACDAECYDRLSSLEEKIQMLEEVVMNLQLTLTNVQSFTMETSLAMLKLQNQVATPVPATPVPATPVPVPATIDTPTIVTLTVTDVDTQAIPTETN
jgi:hypothetical protein